MKKTEKNGGKALYTGIAKIVLEFVSKFIKDWDKKAGNKELDIKYKSLKKQTEKNNKELQKRIEKLTLRLYWTNMLIIILTICVFIELIFLITKF